MASVPELLYHTTLTVIDYYVDTSGSTRKVFVLGTHTQLDKAKEFAVGALKELGYEADDFAEYVVRKPGEEWKHGDGVIVYTKAEAGQEFLVGIDTKDNTEKLPEGRDGQLELPRGVDHLHYVLQTKIDYNQDRSGTFQSTEIEGCYIKRADAFAAARKALASGEGALERDDFAQYDERKDGAESTWPFGEDVLVHAIAQTGENYTVAVRTVPGAHKQHAKKN
ncbi:uncharacterized protein MKZ38_008266 [Zalerion maritima]|uniref:Uncharacterized protein n=1 Tax=Zalerion maritima TaxID=339359 RepID=A0AAD5RW09_9PEZI|nr:uncharacterized protein MKZ38_008266 [Zalerion maritima]